MRRKTEDAMTRRAVRSPGALRCPRWSRTFLIGPGFVMELAATGRLGAGGPAEMRCAIWGHVWWSKHPEALSKARTAMRAERRAV